MSRKDLEMARSMFAERALETAVRLGTKQYLVFGSAHNMFAYRKPYWANAVQVIELDTLNRLTEKLRRLERKGVQIPDDVCYVQYDCGSDAWTDRLAESGRFEPTAYSMCCLMGLSARMTKSDFAHHLRTIASVISEGSAVVFDYDEIAYSYNELELLLSACGYHIYEHTTPEEMEALYFRYYNVFNHLSAVKPPIGINYCLAVKKIMH